MHKWPSAKQRRVPSPRNNATSGSNPTEHNHFWRFNNDALSSPNKRDSALPKTKMAQATYGAHHRIIREAPITQFTSTAKSQKPLT
ncbi:unnamed protein product [Arctia plantaginis]|uniref:Uncharacterized protein n=1 Tax=Arctia plantaginis TaxID=874455 RepID=A0A8S0YZ12_ARCPL|nr:unnamed protein product [Arctia plantaginis]